MVIPRDSEAYVKKLAGIFPAVGIIGPRQVGKTTLVRELTDLGDGRESIYLDLEAPRDRARLERDAFAFLEERAGYRVVIDEVQVMPELFSVLRPVIDADRRPGRFLLLGSASPQLIRGANESLAGRIGYHELTPLTLGELNAYPDLERRHWLRGGYPLSLLLDDDEASDLWRASYLETYVTRELPRLGVVGEPGNLRTLLQMLSGQQGELLNYSSLARSVGATQKTVKSYVELLDEAFLLRRLPPFHVNVRKRLVKAPKAYVRDSGLLHALLGVDETLQLTAHPAVGASWEGYVVEQVVSSLGPRVRAYFYRTHAGAEMDLVLVGRAGRIACLEVKRSSAPTLTKGFHHARADLGPSMTLVVAPVGEAYALGDGVEAVGVAEAIERLRGW